MHFLLLEQGAPCDIFISAGQCQMKTLDEKSLLLENTKKDLVLVDPKDPKISGLSDLNTDKVKKIAIGEPKALLRENMLMKFFKGI